MIECFDFFIPQKYQGKRIVVKENLVFNIPPKVQYLIVNPLEDEEEFLGCQDDSDRQEIHYYGEDRKYVASEYFDKQIITSDLMFRLEKILEKL